MTFLEWCRAQRKRPDAIGDFARDWCADPERPRAPSESDMVTYLYDLGALEEAVVAGKAAYREWRATRRRPDPLYADERAGAEMSVGGRSGLAAGLGPFPDCCGAWRWTFPDMQANQAEHDAVAAERARIRAAVEALRRPNHDRLTGSGEIHQAGRINALDAVLAFLEDKP